MDVQVFMTCPRSGSGCSILLYPDDTPSYAIIFVFAALFQ